MLVDDRLGPARRRFYAALVAGGTREQDPRVEAAFAAVPRERFLGPGPWWTSTGTSSAYLATPDDDPVWLCQDLVFALDRERRIHNGQPSLHALCLAHLAIRPGQRIVHVGAGSGYYTAILAELAGAGGEVDAYEIDPALAARARSNLAGRWPAVRLHEDDGIAAGTTLPEAAVDAIYLNASATAPSPAWLRALRPGGRLIFPLTPTDDGGAMLLVTRGTADRHAARTITAARFIPAHGAQDPKESAALAAAFRRGRPDAVRSLRLGTAPNADTCWVEGAGWWLSTAAPEAV